ncbi:MAG: DUF2924 domain-containing protein [Opitutales bacterium]|jgi:hypothetical protein
MIKNTYEQKINRWEETYEALSLKVQRKLNRLIKQYEKTRSINIENEKSTTIIPGTKLIRDFKGKKYEVQVMENGYMFNNKVYSSLSSIANEITGSHWNGNKFFGVT